MQKLPDEILEGRNLLEKAEAETDDIIRTQDFENGIDILNDYLSDNPKTPYKKLIENLKLTYTKKFLGDLSGLMTTDIEIWFCYIKLIIKVPDEIKLLTETNPKFKASIQKFVDVWKQEFFEFWQGG